MKKTFTYLILATAFICLNAVAFAQTGASPFLNSTHTYTVTMEDGTNNVAEWVIADDSGTPLSPQPSMTTDVSGNTATMELTWADSWAVATTDYKVIFTETDNSSTCLATRELDVTVTVNNFSLTMSSDDTGCHDLSGQVLASGASGNTTVYFTVNLNAGWSIDSWEFDFTVDVDGTDYSLQSVTVAGGSDLGTSGTYTDQSISGSSTAQIAVVINGPVSAGTFVTVEVENGQAIKGTAITPDNGSGDKTQVMTVSALPATSDISTDE